VVLQLGGWAWGYQPVTVKNNRSENSERALCLDRNALKKGTKIIFLVLEEPGSKCLTSELCGGLAA
jgi:hypothetical protein